jgi:hypothetical protein
MLLLSLLFKIFAASILNSVVESYEAISKDRKDAVAELVAMFGQLVTGGRNKILWLKVNISISSQKFGLCWKNVK